MRIFYTIACLFCLVAAHAQQPLRTSEPVSFSRVNITDNFWKPKMLNVANATLGACIYQTEIKTPRIRNFEKVANKKGEKHEGIYYDDSDVYKALEAIAYSLKNNPNPALEKKADEWIDKIVAAQLPDGYINTYYTLGDLSKRWTDMEKHEDYNAGHLIEAAVAYYNTTGKRKLLDAAIRFADHIDLTFRRQNRHWVSGHQEIELALMKLYHITSEKRYLQLADWFLDQRGRGYGKGVIWDQWKDPKYCQDDVPVKSQKEITGHAVRAMYMYTGAADVASVTGDSAYIKAMKTVWEDVVHRNMYITGGIGSSGSNEGFSTDYDLPNENAYCETCASVGMVFWNHRMNLLTGDAKYIDVLERSLYNGALDGLSLTGDRFFYGNPLASRGQYSRREWFGTACCPSNIARLVSSVGDYIYAQRGDSLWINLFIANTATISTSRGDFNIEMKTNYPWSGQISIKLTAPKAVIPRVFIRIPGWAQNQAVPGELYMVKDSIKLDRDVSYRVSDHFENEIKDGYMDLSRILIRKSEPTYISIEFPMNVQTIAARKEVKQNNDRLAIQCGPLLYCVEGTDNNNQAWNILLPPKTQFSKVMDTILNEKIVSLKANVPVVTVSPDGTNVRTETKTITAIPYYTWGNRGQTQMQVWLPSTIKDIKLNY
jgi:uncharacterized protein